MNFKNLIVISLFALAGCGGGGGTSAINSGAVYATDAGSAAIGAAMSNAAISIQPLPSGSNAEITLIANASGTFTIPAGTKFPAIVKATSLNKQYTYYGYIKSADQVGIPVNPITTTLLTLAAGGHPSAITTALSDAALSTARTQTATLFSALLAATSQSNATDFLSKTFSTDHTGLDLVLDSIGIQLSNTGVISVSNKMTGAVTVVNPQSVTAIAFDQAAIAQMNTLPIQLCANFLNGLTSQQLASNMNLYATGFLDSGRDRDRFISDFITNAQSQFSVSMPVFAGLDANENLQFSVQLGNANEYITDYGFSVKKDLVSGDCTIIGNQHPFEITIQPAIKSTIRVDGLLTNVVTKYSGLEIYIGAQSHWLWASNDINGVRIKSARIDVCNAANSCTLLVTLTNTGGAARGILDIDGLSANNKLRMVQNTNVNLFADISNPIKITFFSSDVAPLSGNANSIGVINTRATAPEFTATEVDAIQMPEMINSSLLASPLLNPTVNWSSGSGVISGIDIESTGLSVTNSDWRMIFKSGTGFTSFNIVDVPSVAYKKIDISAHIPNRPGMLETKYIWAPTCPSCY
jgi:hypothetical protein